MTLFKKHEFQWHAGLIASHLTKLSWAGEVGVVQAEDTNDVAWRATGHMSLGDRMMRTVGQFLNSVSL